MSKVTVKDVVVALKLDRDDIKHKMTQCAMSVSNLQYSWREAKSPSSFMDDELKLLAREAAVLVGQLDILKKAIAIIDQFIEDEDE